ncbi:Zn-dependent hydrolases [Pelotomaculum thermopropionicum SI]|uniref:Zn-dependent hydrolases n=1 Tax=Pelotomaculum thermopropionicum (strain DSM 13744 / JCM 10971 / SI) TaxID=370438 RepID=A5CYR5_PELTS|nr:Zn-dependent hydrolases [Pelotomaculum thermopropionicum SI]
MEMKKPDKVYERVYLVGGPEITDERDCCVYLVDGGSELALVDAGLGFSGRQILDNIRSSGIDPSLLKYVVATHGHIDHIGGLHFFQSLGAKVVCHELEKKAVSEGRPELTAEWYYNVKYRPVNPDLILSGDGEDLPVGDLKLHCLFTPGHTPGGVSLYLDVGGTRILFGQDIHGPFDPSWGADTDEWKKSMKKLLELKADILCEGHYGIYRPASRVKDYIESCLRSHA